jgi:hypothetical protein
MQPMRKLRHGVKGPVFFFVGVGGGVLGDHHSFSFFLSFSMRLYVYCTAFIIRAIIKLFAVNDFYYYFFFQN